MLMASRVEFRDEGRAVAARFRNQVIGDRAIANIQAAIDALDRAGSAPVERIRGRAHARGFGLLSLTALTFATIKGAGRRMRMSHSWMTTASPTRTWSMAYSSS